ncbi:MAG TPA: hypothetical protein VMZ92_15125, partial [Planctomycetota bacterium]|nr:hypothetical protein [Planctomycetota bacterium]
MASPRNWQPILGDFEITQQPIKFIGSIYTDSQSQQQAPRMGLAMCDVGFSGGTISVAVDYQGAPAIPSAQIVVYRNAETNSFLSAGIDGGFVTQGTTAQFLITSFEGGKGGPGFSRLAGTQFVGRPPDDHITLRLTQRGSMMSLYANDVQVLRHTLNSPVPASQCGIYCHATCTVEFSDYLVDTSSRSAFVIMEFS